MVVWDQRLFQGEVTLILTWEHYEQDSSVLAMPGQKIGSELQARPQEQKQKQVQMQTSESDREREHRIDRQTNRTMMTSSQAAIEKMASRLH
jgi:hypothetical protein